MWGNKICRPTGLEFSVAQPQGAKYKEKKKNEIKKLVAKIKKEVDKPVVRLTKKTQTTPLRNDTVYHYEPQNWKRKKRVL